MRNSRFLGVIAVTLLIISAFNEGDSAIMLSIISFSASLVGIICDSIEKIGAKNVPTRRSSD